MAVRVGVRIRPFNNREKQQGARLIVQMEEQVTTVTDPDAAGKQINNTN
jgi:hypothetical protein